MGQKRHELVSVPAPIQLVQSLMCLCILQMLQFLRAVEEEYEGDQ